MKKSVGVTKCLDVNESAAVFSNPPTIRPEVASFASRYLDKITVLVKKHIFPPYLMPFYFCSSNYTT